MRDIVLVGKGYWGKNIARNLNALERLGIIADVDPDTVRATAEEYPDVEVTGDITKAIENERIRGVFIATPAVTHAELAIRAMRAGKDVFVEKPMCLSHADGERMAAVAEEEGRVLMVGHILLYHPVVLKLKELIDEGELGHIRYVYSNRLNLGKIRTEENAFWSFAPHDISVMNFLLGEPPATVRSEGKAYLTPSIHDVTMTSLEYPSGVAGHIFVSWLHPYKEQRLVIVGEKKMAVFSDTADDKLVVYPHTVEWINRQPVPQKAEGEAVKYGDWEPLRRECEHFLECMESRDTPRSNGREGLRVLEVLLASDRSAAAGGKAVQLKEAPERDYFVHESAYADEGAEIGAGTKVWHFGHVMKGAKIGKGCIFGQNVNVDGGTVIGNNVKVQNNVSIYTGTVVEDDVFLGPSCVLTNVTNPRSQVNRHSLYEKTTFKRGCSVGANATIVCGVTIGRYAFVGAGAVVTKNVPDYAMMVGVPARRRCWVSRHGVPLPEPDGEGVMVCPESGLKYKEVEPGVVRCLDLDEEEPLPEAMRKGTKPYDAFKTAE